MVKKNGTIHVISSTGIMLKFKKLKIRLASYMNTSYKSHLTNDPCSYKWNLSSKYLVITHNSLQGDLSFSYFCNVFLLLVYYMHSIALLNFTGIFLISVWNQSSFRIHLFVIFWFSMIQKKSLMMPLETYWVSAVC